MEVISIGCLKEKVEEILKVCNIKGRRKEGKKEKNGENLEFFMNFFNRFEIFKSSKRPIRANHD